MNKHILDYQHQKEIQLAQDNRTKATINPYDTAHDDCRRFFVYFTSRIGIVYNPITNKQKFYEGHRSKITCHSIHPLKFYVATGEAHSK